MSTKKCVICGKEFLVIKSSKTCSSFCSHIHKLNSMKKWQDVQYNLNPNYRKINYCPLCNKPIYQRAKFCRSCSTKEYIKKNGHPLKGIGHTKESKLKISMNKKGKGLAYNNPNWKGGKKFDGNGYIQIYYPNHPYAINGRYVYEHRLVMEKYLGRFLKPNEIVHHTNRDKTDNRLENLELFTSSEHSKLHYEEHQYLQEAHSKWLINKKILEEKKDGI